MGKSVIGEVHRVTAIQTNVFANVGVGRIHEISFYYKD